MGQYWKIFNITQGKVMFIHDGSKYCEKSLSIDVLLYLLQNSWKNNKIVMIGDYDETDECTEFTREFLSRYSLNITNPNSSLNNLYNLDSRDYLPRKAYIPSSYFDTTYLNVDLSQKVIPYLKSIGKLKKNLFYSFLYDTYFVLNKHEPIDENNLILYKPIETDDDYVFINHSNKEYLLFNKQFFNGFYIRNYRNKLKPLTMTTIKYNHLVKDIVLGLITNNSEFKENLNWHGRFASKEISFEKINDFSQNYHFDTYINISDIFIGETVNKNELYRDFSDIIYTMNPKYDLNIESDEDN